MTQEEADKAQNWLGMDGATAWHLIDRHADDWSDVGELMNAWLRAHVLAEREACALIAEKEAQMRRELADCQAHKARLAAASEKRARKAAKRLKNAALRGDSGLITGVPLESMVRGGA